MKTVKKVCIIDDDPVFVFGAKILLRKNDFCSDVKVYKNGKEALEHIMPGGEENEDAPDVIILDLNMPVMDGWEFLDEVSKLSKIDKKPIFVVSSTIDPKEVQRIKSYDVVHDFIEKPLSKEKIRLLKDKLKTAEK